MKIVFSILIFLGLSINCFASTYVIYNSDTKEVYSLSSEDDALVPQGYSKVILKDDMKDLDLIYPHKFYKYQNKTLVSNRQKLEQEAQKEEEQRSKFEQEKLIQGKMREMAIQELIKEGKLSNETR